MQSKNDIDMNDLIGLGRRVIVQEANALHLLLEALGETFSRACLTILGAQRQLVVTGMGKSGHIARKIAATFSATGTPAIFIHPAEASHGDMGMLVEGDLLLVLSNSGNTQELREIIAHAKARKITVIGVAADQNSLVMRQADIQLAIPKISEACPENIAPTTSTTMQLALGDAMAITVMQMRGVTRDELFALHPAGTIGRSLAPVHSIMHTGERIPLVKLNDAIPETISAITAGCLGVAGVTDDIGSLVGIITDGDLRRNFSQLDQAAAKDIMTRNPKTIMPDITAADAISFLNANNITAAFVVENANGQPSAPLGIIHIHDLMRLGLG